MKKKGLELLKKLTEAHGAPGNEVSVRKIFARELGQNLSSDYTGNIICRSNGTSDKPKIMLEAHMDEVGFMIQAITKSGYLKIVSLGGWWPNTLLSQRVRILTRSGQEVIGIISCKPPHFLTKEDRNKVINIENMFVDVGAESNDEVINVFGICIGDSVVPDSKFMEMTNPSYLLAKAFDNRVGMALAIQSTQYFFKKDHPNTLFTVGTVQEEVGLRGAQTAVNTVNPEVAIILEGPPADDFPDSNQDLRQARLGGGVQIRLMDPSAIMNRPFTEFVIETAKKHSIQHQITVRSSGGTDAKAIQKHGRGVPSVVLGVPARYIHSHNSIIHISDYLSALKLVIEIIKGIDGKLVKSFKSL